MRTIPKITIKSVSVTNQSVTPTLSIQLSQSPTGAEFAIELQESSSQAFTTVSLRKKEKWLSREYREAYLEGFLEQNIALQIKLNRQIRNLSQSDLAQLIGTKQSVVARSENPAYGKHSIQFLTKVANAFDCALSVKFIPYSKLARQVDSLSEEKLIAPSFDEEIAKLRIQNEIK